jgi:uncharacterized protein YukE
MSNAEVSMEYEAMEAAAQEYMNASQIFSEMIQKLQRAGETLNNRAFHGGTGIAAQAVAQGLINRLNVMKQRAEEMAKDITYNVESFRGDVDPGIAQSFTN